MSHFPPQRAVHPKFWSLLFLETGLGEQPTASSCAHKSGPNTQVVSSFPLQELWTLPSPWNTPGQGPTTYFALWSTSHLKFGWAIELKTLVLKHTVTGKFGVVRVNFFGQSRLSWFFLFFYSCVWWVKPNSSVHYPCWASQHGAFKHMVNLIHRGEFHQAVH